MSATKTIRLGAREIPRMGLGTNRLTETPENIELIRAVGAAGIGLIDTAHLYTGGSSEQTIGASLGDATVRPVVATKGGYRPGEGRPQVLAAQIEQSVRALRVTRIYLYYLHRVDPETPLEESARALAEHRDRGVIDNVGLSEVGVDEIERAREIVPITAVQNHYNLDERRWDDVIDYCTREGIVFVPFFPLRAQGGSHVAAIARAHGVSRSQITLAWLLRRSPQMLPIPGTLSLAHARQNAAALDIELTDDEFEAMSAR